MIAAFIVDNLIRINIAYQTISKINRISIIIDLIYLLLDFNG